MFLLFRFPPIAKIFKLFVRFDTTSISENRLGLFSCLISDEEFMKILRENLSKNFENEALNSVAKKVKQQKDDEFPQFDENDVNILVNSLAFSMEGISLTETLLKTPLSDVLAQNPKTVFNVSLNLSSSSSCDSDDSPSSAFFCPQHANEKFTHFCNSCESLVCPFDIIPNCKHHIDDILTLKEFQIETETLIRNGIEEMKELLVNMITQNIKLGKNPKNDRMKGFVQLENCAKLQEEIHKSQKLLIQSENDVNQQFATCNYPIIEKMLHFRSANKMFVDDITNPNLNNDMEFVELDQQIAEKVAQLKEIGEENILKYEENILQRMERIKKIVEESQTSQILKQELQLEAPETLSSTITSASSSNDVKNVVNVACLYSWHYEDFQDVKQFLEAMSRDGIQINVSYSKDLNENGAEDEFASRSWDNDDVIMVWTWGSPFPNWCGDLLDYLHGYGKGIVLCLGPTCKEEDYGSLEGLLDDELPFVKGDLMHGDGPKNLKKLVPDHPILKNVKSFNGGSGSWRSTIKVLTTAKQGEDIRTVAVWDDAEKTPLIVCKDYFDDKEEFGNMAILNFWPSSSNVPGYNLWDATTDGDKILQNAVVWANAKHKKRISSLFWESKEEHEIEKEEMKKRLQELGIFMM